MSEDVNIQAPPLMPLAEPEPGSGRLIATLGIAGFFSGLILVSTYLFTLPMIQAHRAAALQRAIYQVLPGVTSFEPLILQEGTLSLLPEGEALTQGEESPRVFAGYDESGKLVGFAVSAQEPGFQDIIAGIFGYDPEKAAIIGFEVLESKETPGLGDKIMKDQAFRTNFTALAVDPQIVAVKKGEKRKANEVEAITGATISSKAVVRLLDKGMGEWREVMEGFAKSERKEKQ